RLRLDIGKRRQRKHYDLALARLGGCIDETVIELSLAPRGFDFAYRVFFFVALCVVACLDAVAKLMVEMIARLGIDLVVLAEHLDQRRAHERCNAPDGTLGQVGTQDQRLVPGSDLLRPRDDVVECVRTHLRIWVGEQRGNGGHVERGDDRIRHIGAQEFALGDCRERRTRLGCGDDFHQVGVGEKRRIFEDGSGDDHLQIDRQPADDLLRHAVERLDLFGQDRAHARQLVVGEFLQRLDGERAELLAFLLVQIGHQPADLARQLDAHLVVLVVRKQAVGLGWRAHIGGHRAADHRRTLGRQIQQHVRPRVGAGRQFVVGGLLALFQYLKDLIARELFRCVGLGAPGRHGFPPVRRSFARTALRFLEGTWLPARPCGLSRLRPSSGAMPTAPDFRHIRTWIFDLDNTLYRADSDLFAQIDRRMQAFVMRFLNVDAEEARRIQKAYYRDHGTTLTGLIKLHDADPEEFLAEVHDIDLAAIDVDARLVEAIAALPGKRFVFTNGCRHHAERVLIRTGLTDF